MIVSFKWEKEEKKAKIKCDCGEEEKENIELHCEKKCLIWRIEQIFTTCGFNIRQK